MKDLNDIISDYMTKRGVKDEHFITPQQWMIIATEFAKEVAKDQRVICSKAARMTLTDDGCSWNCNNFYLDKESILNAKSPV